MQQHSPYLSRPRRQRGSAQVVFAAALCLAAVGTPSSSLSWQYGGLSGAWSDFAHGPEFADPATRDFRLAPRHVEDDDDDHDDEEVKIDRGHDVHDGDSDDMEIEVPPASPVTMGPIEGVLSSSVSLPRAAPAITIDNVCDDALACVMQFLPLQAAHGARALSRAFNAAVDRVTYMPPFAHGRLLFTRWLEPVVPKRAEPNAPPRPFVWLCASCGSASDNHQRCASCLTPVDRAACRVFLGQMPKRATAEAASHMIRVLLPDVEPLHIESHTMRSGHEKGCAWVYLRSITECQRLLSLNKRVFFDEADGYIGFWTVPADDRMTLSRFAESRSAAPRQPLLPRNALTSEFSIGSLLRTSLEAASAAFGDANWTHTEAGWYVPAAGAW